MFCISFLQEIAVKYNQRFNGLRQHVSSADTLLKGDTDENDWLFAIGATSTTLKGPSDAISVTHVQLFVKKDC
jgi:hypothetical protein